MFSINYSGNNIYKILEVFLANNYQKGLPVLLALSGGVDSLVLFHLLLDYRKVHADFLFGVAHVDHCWRITSTKEAEQLKEYVLQYDVPWHDLKIDTQVLQGNLENACREIRLKFFEELSLAHKYQAVILGHHRDDQSETVLKRLLESSSLYCLEGMGPVSTRNGLTLWRPLLSIPKKVLQTYASKLKLTPIEDTTNEDEAYLRVRMRKQIIPNLNQLFGKDVASSLAHIGKEAEELNDYLNKKIENIKVVEGWGGEYVDFGDENEPCIIRHYLKRFIESRGVRLSREQIDELIIRVIERDSNIRIGSFIIDRGYLFFVNQSFLESMMVEPKKLILDENFSVGSWGNWRIQVDRDVPSEIKTGWREAWQGSLSLTLNPGIYSFEEAKPKAYTLHQKELGRWWTEKKVPAFMRLCLPVICDRSGVVHEFLSGSSQPGAGLKIQLLAVEAESLI